LLADWWFAWSALRLHVFSSFTTTLRSQMKIGKFIFLIDSLACPRRTRAIPLAVGKCLGDILGASKHQWIEAPYRELVAAQADVPLVWLWFHDLNPKLL
jgi:hypothetical protein